MGMAAVSLSGLWSWALVIATLKEPLPIALTVLAAGALFYFFQNRFKRVIASVTGKVGLRISLFLLVMGLGLLSSVMTAVITPLILAEVLILLRLRREVKVRIAVLSCLSIGLGSTLTPLGGPLTAIAVARLKEAPVQADFFFMARLLGPWLLPLILVLALAAAFYPFPKSGRALKAEKYKSETAGSVAARAFKIYLFVMGLILLGTGLTPMANRFLTDLSPRLLYWVNLLSAVLDNATMAAAEVNPAMSLETLRYVMMGLLLSGIMLIPGNLPNIIAANKLGIKSGEWAKSALPLGLLLMVAYFVLLMILGG
jgi:predicted cation transporter